MRVRIAIVKCGNEYVAYGNDSHKDTKLIEYLREYWDDMDGDIFFVECDLPEKPPILVGEIVV